MTITFSVNAWDDYVFWINEDKKITKKMNDLIKEIQRHPFDGIGKPEPLRFDLKGFWSRRIDREHRLVYQVLDNELLIYGCRYHYD